MTEKNDSYVQAFTGFGTRFDRTSFTKFQTDRRLSQQELELLYICDGFAKRILDVRCEDMLRAGFKITGVNDELKIQARFEELDAGFHWANALRWSDQFGGALIVQLINDGGNFEEPLKEDAIRKIEELRVYDRFQVSVKSRYTDAMQPKFGMPELWEVQANSGANYLVHESRCLIFDGEPCSYRQRRENQGWGMSYLQHCFKYLENVGTSTGWAIRLLERAQQAIHKMPNLSQELQDDDGKKAIQDRVMVVDMVRSILNTIVIDAMEDYDLKATSFAAIPDLLDRICRALCAITGIPEFYLFQTSLSGLNSNGKTEESSWFAKVAQMQKVKLLRPLDRHIGLIMREQGNYKDDYKIEFNPLGIPTDKEVAEIYKMRADARKSYFEIGALSPQEIREELKKEGAAIDDSLNETLKGINESDT